MVSLVGMRGSKSSICRPQRSLLHIFSGTRVQSTTKATKTKHCDHMVLFCIFTTGDLSTEIGKERQTCRWAWSLFVPNTVLSVYSFFWRKRIRANRRVRQVAALRSLVRHANFAEREEREHPIRPRSMRTSLASDTTHHDKLFHHAVLPQQKRAHQSVDTTLGRPRQALRGNFWNKPTRLRTLPSLHYFSNTKVQALKRPIPRSLGGTDCLRSQESPGGLYLRLHAVFPLVEAAVLLEAGDEGLGGGERGVGRQAAVGRRPRRPRQVLIGGKIGRQQQQHFQQQQQRQQQQQQPLTFRRSLSGMLQQRKRDT